MDTKDLIDDEIVLELTTCFGKLATHLVVEGDFGLRESGEKLQTAPEQEIFSPGFGEETGITATRSRRTCRDRPLNRLSRVSARAKTTGTSSCRYLKHLPNLSKGFPSISPILPVVASIKASQIAPLLPWGHSLSLIPIMIKLLLAQLSI